MHISAAYTFLFSTPHPSTRTQRQESLVTPIPTRETNARYDPSDCVFFSSVGDPAHRSSIPILGNVDEVCIYSVLPSTSGRTAQESPWVWPGVLTLASWKLVRCEWKLAFGRHRLRLSQPTSSVGVQEEDSHITAIGPTNSRNKCASASAERTQPSKLETEKFSGEFGFCLLAAALSAPAFLNLLMGTLKIIFDYYPGRLHKAFVVDPPSLFSYLWKVRCQGVRPFVELSVVTAVVSSLDFDDSIEDAAFASCRTRAASLRFDPVVAATARLGGSTSSRFSFNVSHLDSLKPWYLSTTTRATPRAVMPTASPSLVGASPLNARSFSFASPAARYTPRASRSIPSTPCSFPPPKHPNQQQQQTPRTPRPSFLQSPATLFTFWKEGQAVVSRGERERESFLPFLRFYRRPYDEMAYRSKMRSPLGGLVSIISPHLKQQQLQ
ncbi:hypothetical protein BHM03_00049165 [Ensete ventricosum]|nr:hypothetical protein BHM03_00049165 [Ensete ventricosum]